MNVMTPEHIVKMHYFFDNNIGYISDKQYSNNEQEGSIKITNFMTLRGRGSCAERGHISD